MKEDRFNLQIELRHRPQFQQSI